MTGRCQRRVRGPLRSATTPPRSRRYPQRRYLFPMAIARFKDLCLDAGDPERLGTFWAAVLGRTWQAKQDGDGLLTGPTSQHTIWVNRVREPKTVKHRVHLDIYARDLADLEALGATIVEPWPHWTVMADPEGGEFDAFLRPELPAERLHGLAVDCADPQAQAQWWGDVYGVSVTANDGWFTLEGVPGMPILTMDFAQVPDRKSTCVKVGLKLTTRAYQTDRHRRGERHESVASARCSYAPRHPGRIRGASGWRPGAGADRGQAEPAAAGRTPGHRDRHPG